MKVFNLLENKYVVYSLAALSVTLSSYLGWHLGKPVYQEYQASFAAKEFRELGIRGTYEKHFFSFLGKMHNLVGLEHENEELQGRIADLEKKTTLSEAAQSERDLAALNEHLEMKLKGESGSSEARIPQAIAYTVPEHLNHNQLYTLGLGYFRKQEYEKSAVIFTYLLSLSDDHSFERGENYLLNAISWYELKDFNRAAKLVQEAQKHSQKADPVHRDAVLWQAMIEKSLGKEKVAQTTLLYFLGQYPHSEEGQIINGIRKPSSDGKTEEKTEAKAEEKSEGKEESGGKDKDETQTEE